MDVLRREHESRMRAPNISKKELCCLGMTKSEFEKSFSKTPPFPLQTPYEKMLELERLADEAELVLSAREESEEESEEESGEESENENDKLVARLELIYSRALDCS